MEFEVWSCETKSLEACDKAPNSMRPPNMPFSSPLKGLVKAFKKPCKGL